MSVPVKKPLTKSRFKIGYQCPTKLYYTANKEYGNNKDTNEFLKALAEGGFQVGELAKLYYPGGHEISTLDYDEAVAQTDALLQQDKVIIYEAAFRFENLFIRVDVLVKDGSRIELTEVKAKSFDSTEDFEVFAKNQLKKGIYELKSDWGEYVLDLAFQTYVLRMSKPHFQVSAGLMLADKSKVSTVDGLNQLFLIQKDENDRPKVVLTKPVSKKDLGLELLTRIELTKEIDLILERASFGWADSFANLVLKLSGIQSSGTWFIPSVGSQCKGCEFRVDKAKLEPPASKSGFEECWVTTKKLQAFDLHKEMVFDVWDFRGVDSAIYEDKFFASNLTETDLKMKAREDDKGGMSRTERQLIQVEFAKGQRKGTVIDVEGLASEIRTFKAPYHFIDFETCMVAIPFHAGRKPYEQMAFQFSHHVVDKDGVISHRTEYLDDRRGVFPNFDFVRALRKALAQDDGTVFRFAAHENTVLNQIHQQLAESSEKDRDELMAWIETLTTPSKKHPNPWVPSRQFIDMRDLTLRYYYLPETRGSNSIKKVLPAVLNHSGRDLGEKFPGYIMFDEKGAVIDPYKMLPPIFSDVPAQELLKIEQRLVDRDDLNDGGAALMAWSRMQFTEMSDVERVVLREALLRYCALDTLAMVMIWDWWMLQIRLSGKRVA